MTYSLMRCMCKVCTIQSFFPWFLWTDTVKQGLRFKHQLCKKFTYLPQESGKILRETQWGRGVEFSAGNSWNWSQNSLLWRSESGGIYVPASEVTPPKLSSPASTPQAAGCKACCGDFVKSKWCEQGLDWHWFFGCLIQATIFFFIKLVLLSKVNFSFHLLTMFFSRSHFHLISLSVLCCLALVCLTEKHV